MSFVSNNFHSTTSTCVLKCSRDRCRNELDVVILEKWSFWRWTVIIAHSETIERVDFALIRDKLQIVKNMRLIHARNAHAMGRRKKTLSQNQFNLPSSNIYPQYTYELSIPKISFTIVDFHPNTMFFLFSFFIHMAYSYWAVCVLRFVATHMILNVRNKS